MKDDAKNWRNDFAILKSKTEADIQREKEKLVALGIPTFRYHPNPLATGAFVESEESVICACCGETNIYYEEPYYKE